MSDPAVNAQLDGIISDFEALKRSFEVEEIEPPNSTPPRRVQTPLLRATVASSSQKFQDLGVKNSEPAARLVDSLSQRSPKPSLRRVELAGAKAPEPMSRRTEISIDISSKQVESTASAAGPSRFGLKRAEVLGHKTPEPVPRRTEITIVKPQESVLRRVETPASKIPEGSAVPATDAAPKRVEIQVPKPAEAPNCPLPSQTLENSEAPMSQLQSRLEPRPSVAEVPYRNQEDSEVTPSCVGDMADNPRDAMLKQAPASRNEKAPMEFGYVGIDSILEQMRRKAMKQGFEFNIMVVGQSGLGKSTLINTLFKSKISRKSVQPTSEERIPKTIEIKSITHDIEEKGVRMKLTVIDTPGFGDHINNENCWQPIMKFINDQYEKYLQEEVNINRKKRIPDTRVHCCLYFIPATGHSLRPLDIEFMKRLSKVVNIVPVIAKADTLTLEERVYFKQRITADLLSNGIDVYPQKEFDEDAEDRLVNEKFREMIPFAVVGSDHEYQVNGKRILGRKTKWGTIEVENTTHCEFAYLRDLLIRTHMQNIKDITSNIHFEAYRVKRLNEGNSAMANGIEKEPEAQEM
ncbi:septin-9 isoform b [Mus musculus]|uniref:Isoform 3 of Septin-9 n=1 Tax=Mus musculus TaxID=10090 RepID=Q80UG5-3|nr:septin-9 isoform b [Mus musculus]|eukprot:NP_001106959.1 septin-9 isoform b [Mus musculus]